MNSYKHLFSHFLKANPDRLHFSAHSHHYWPDATLDAQTQYWLDSARLADEKWGAVFSDVIPAIQAHIAGLLRLPDPSTIAFAPNTHEFVVRLLSCLPEKPEILTTDSEFHSFNRQVSRLEEDNLVKLTRVQTEPYESFPQRFVDKLVEKHFDLVFFSHVFFNAGYAVQALEACVHPLKDKDTLIVIDGYHGFHALPTDLSTIADRAFYMAGGYKYAMAGEGACFMHCPPGYALRPRDTGWFADIGALENEQEEKVPYATDGYRFWGATFDPSGLYRMRAVFDLMKKEDISVEDIHLHVLELQNQFLEQLDTINHHEINKNSLITPINADTRGHFLTFRVKNPQILHEKLKNTGALTDFRGDRLRFGFALYHNDEDVRKLINKIKNTA